VDYHVDPQIVEEWNLPVHYTPRMVTLTSPARTIFAAGERADSNHPEVALEKFLAAQKMPGLLPITTDYLNNRVTEERAIVALNRTPWQSLIPPQDLTGWKAGDGAWHVTGPDALSVDTESQGALLTRLEPVGDTWELRGELVLSSRAAGGRTEAAFFCGPPGDQQHHGFSLRFWKRASGWTGISLARGFGDLAVSRKIDSNGVISFFIRLANHELRVQTNEGLWYADQPLPNGATIDSTALLGLGSTGGGERTVQFRKLEWRGVGGVLSAQSSVGNVTANAANDE
jgi:hypothetical protein